MPSRLHQDASAEREANEKGAQLMYSNNPIHDLGNMYGASAVGAVNIYNDASANQRVSSAGVDALAQGGNIYFGSGLYPATTPAQKGLLGHEMNHAVLQQQGEAPMGVAQGGLFDWFNNFLRAPSNKNRDRVPETEAGGRWKSDEEAQDFDQSVLVNHNNMPNIVKASSLDNDRLESLWQNPVFETHSFAPQESVDGEAAKTLHSYVGLRYTYFDRQERMYRRVRSKFGFGSRGLSSNNDYQSDMSTETPLKAKNVEELAYEMVRIGGEPYRFFKNNCNHFTQRAAMAAGARLPAQLHNTRGGPYGAHLNLGEAASEYAGENARNAADGTRFFQGGTRFLGQMRESFKLLNNFYPMAEKAAKSDGCPLNKNQDLKDALENLEILSKAFFSNYNRPTTEAIARQKENFIQDIQRLKEAKDRVLLTTVRRTHPRLNFVVLKVMAIAETEQHFRYPTIRKYEDMTPQEQDRYLSKVNEENTALSDLLAAESIQPLGTENEAKSRKDHMDKMDRELYGLDIGSESSCKPIADVLGFSYLPMNFTKEDIDALSPRLEAIWEKTKDKPDDDVFFAFDFTKAIKGNLSSARSAEYMFVLGLNGCYNLNYMPAYLASEKIEAGGAPADRKDLIAALQNYQATLAGLMRKSRIRNYVGYPDHLRE